MGQADRMKCFYSFNHSRGGIFVTTGVAARGLDFPDVGWIVQYDAPGDTSDCVHRVGRTARIDHDGDALLFLHAHELQCTQLLSDRGVVLNALSLQTTVPSSLVFKTGFYNVLSFNFQKLLLPPPPPPPSRPRPPPPPPPSLLLLLLPSSSSSS
jgi:hypothetical protein